MRTDPSTMISSTEPSRLWRALSWFRSRTLVKKIRAGLGRLSRLGTTGYPPDVQRRLVVMNLIAYLIALTTLGYSVQNTYMDYHRYAPVIWLNLAVFCVAVSVPYWHRYSEVAGALIMLIFEYAALFFFTMYLGNQSGIQLQYFVVAAATFVVFGVERWKLIVPMVMLAIILHLSAWFLFPPEAALIDAEPRIINDLYKQAAITTGVLIAATVYYAFSLAEAAKAETEALLRNILPDSVVERLKVAPGEAIADSHDNAAILFTDIKGFVALARELGPERTVELLNEIVTEFDRLAKRHGVEKIKTIGDAYMAAAGIPDPVPDPTARLARLAIDMQRYIEQLREQSDIELSMRVGLASGPVMAGVIGKQKFTYDVWGDTVNLAARLENQSQPGRILVCPDCRKHLGDGFHLESYGVIDIKGVGQQETWFLLAEANNDGPPGVDPNNDAHRSVA
jgi:adenylate cyclase